MSLLRIIYMSEPTGTTSDAEFDQILAVSRRNNQRLGVTGLLCRSESVYIQLLEGDELTVMELYVRIARDPRHCKVRLLYSHLGTDRLVPKWAMADFGPQAIPRFSVDGLEQLRAIDQHDAIARRLMRTILPRLKGTSQLEEAAVAE